MNSKSFAIILLLFIALFVAPVAAAYFPRVDDHFSYYEVTNLGNGVGDYTGYTEYASYNGIETINAINTDGTVFAHYSYTYSWSNSTGATETGNPSGDFRFSPTTFLYVNGTDDQIGYVNPTVWFVMDSSIQVGGTFSLLNTEMTVISTNYSYFLPSQNRNVNVIFAQGQSSYERNDVYGQFSATYTWKAYFDPSTGYIVGYRYDEHDTNPSGTGFTYTENLYVTSTSYQLSAASPNNTGGETPTPVPINPSRTTSSSVPYLDYFTGVGLFIVVIVIIVILIYSFSRNSAKTLPQHPYQQPPPPPGPPPENLDLTPKQPSVQQIVIKEVVKVKCRYCGALIDSTVQTCPICGAPRT